MSDSEPRRATGAPNAPAGRPFSIRHSEDRRRRHQSLAVILLILGVHAAGRIGGYCCPIEADDSYIYASFGYRIAHGDVLYRDMSDIKPPGLYLLYALVYLVAPAARCWIAPIESAFLLLAYYVVYRFGVERFGRRAGLASAVVGALAVNYFAVTGFAIGGFGVAENFMVFPAAAAALFYLRGSAGGRTAPVFLAGVFMGVDTCIKQTALPLVAAVVAHHLMITLVVDRSWRRLVGGLGLLFAGGCIGWAPALAILVAQGTLTDAYDLLTRDAGAMFGRSSALPSQWRDVLPLVLPLVWGVWAFLCWFEGKVRSRGTNVGLAFRDIAFLVIWCGLETYLLANLPLRSTHYYVAACVPFVLLSGAAVAVFDAGVARWNGRTRVVAWSMAVIGAAVFYRSTVNEIVPRAIASGRSYDWKGEDRKFREAIDWGPIHFGRGDPFIAAPDDR